MTNAASLGMIDLADLEWPITWRYLVSGPFGLSQLTLSVNAPDLFDDPDASFSLGDELWDRSIAHAMSRQTRVEFLETMCWKGFAIPTTLPRPNTTGKLFTGAASREHSACLVLHSGHADNYARRRLILPGSPANWEHEGMLTDEARGQLENLAHAMVMGMCGHLTGAPVVWLLAYPNVVTAGFPNYLGVAFRRVEYVRICWHTDKAPETSVT